MGGACSAMEVEERRIQDFGGVRTPLEGPREDGRIILRRIFRKWGVGVWIGLIWLRIGTGCGLL